MAIKTVTLQATESVGVWSTKKDSADRTSKVFPLVTFGGDYDIAGLLTKYTPNDNIPEILYKPLKSFKARAYVEFTPSGKDKYLKIYAAEIYDPFDINTVTYATRPDTNFNTFHPNYFQTPSGQAYKGYTDYFVEDSIYYARRILENGLYYFDQDPTPSGSHKITTSRGANPPELVFEVEDTFVIPSVSSTTPAAGSRINRTKKSTFSFALALKDVSIYDPYVSTAVFVWKKSSDQVENRVPLAPGSKTIEIAANTFPSGEILYKFEAVSNLNQSFSSEWVNFLTTDTLSTAIALSPDGGIVDGDNPPPFVWQHNNASGAPQTGAEIALNRENSGWVNHRLPDSPTMSYTFPAGIIKNGKYEWKVRTRNLDGVDGSWSSTKAFLAVSSPTAPIIVETDDTPRPQIVWQSDGQVAYQIQLDEEKPVTYYGTATSWKSPRYLTDGNHRFKIRVQSEWGEWSKWSATYLNTKNIPGPAIRLEGISGNSAALSWSDEGYDFYVVYRGGKPIAKTTELSYLDNYSVYTTGYKVRGCYTSNNNYGMSNVVELSCSPDEAIICGPDGEWIPIGLSDKQYNTAQISRGQKITSRYLAGRPYPVSEVSPFKSKRIDMSFASIAPEVKDAIEALVGQLVCLKLPHMEMIRGYLMELPCTEGPFYAVYSLSITQEYIPEVVVLD